MTDKATLTIEDAGKQSVDGSDFMFDNVTAPRYILATFAPDGSLSFGPEAEAEIRRIIREELAIATAGILDKLGVP